MIITLTNLLSYEIGPHTVKVYLLALGLFLLLFFGFKFFKKYAVSRFKKLAKRTDNDFDDLLVESLEEVRELFYWVVSLYFPLRLLVEHPTADRVIEGIFIVVVVFQAICFLQLLLEYLLRGFFTKKDAEGEGKTTFGGLKLIIRIVLWTVGLLLILANLGVNITSLVASLGIGGIAVALAVQNILGDVFSSFTIYFDKPFEIGDYILVGEHDGIVEKVGLKTTRIRTLQGEELVISNQELTSARIQNFKKMKDRRISFEIGVTYDTPSKKLEKIIDLVKKIIDDEENAEFLRAYFTQFGDFSLKFEVVYYVLSPEYEDYLKVQQNINFAIKRAFEKEKIEMAFPTQTVYLEK